MAFTPPILPQVSFQGPCQDPLEPVDITDSSPYSLYVLCAKCLIKNISKITINRKLPADVCDNLIELFRVYGQQKDVNKFIRALSSKQCSVVSANLTNLPLSQEDLMDFVDSQKKTLKYLGISKTDSEKATVELLAVNRIFLKTNDVDNLCRMVSVYEVPNLSTFVPFPFQPVMRKLYHKGKIYTHVNKFYMKACPESHFRNSFLLKMECPEYSQPTLERNAFTAMPFCAAFERRCSKIPRTAYEMNREMGLFCDPYFTKEFMLDEESSAYACYDSFDDDYRSKQTLSQDPGLFIKPKQIIKSENSLFSEDDDLKPNQCAYCHGNGSNVQKIRLVPKSFYHSLNWELKVESPKFYNAAAIFYHTSQIWKYSYNSTFLTSFCAQKQHHEEYSQNDEDGDIYHLQIPEHDADRLNLLFSTLPHTLEYFFKLIKNRQGSDELDSGTKTDSDSGQNSKEANSSADSQQMPCMIVETDSLSSNSQSSISSMTAATSSSCPILSSCENGSNFQIFCNGPTIESAATPNDSSSVEYNHFSIAHDHDYRKIWKKFRPHSHNTFKTSRSDIFDVGESGVFSIQRFKNSSNNTTPSPTDLSQISPLFPSSTILDSHDSNTEKSGPKKVKKVDENDRHEIYCPLHPQNCPPEYEYSDFLDKIYNMESEEEITPEQEFHEDRLRFNLFPNKLYCIFMPQYNCFRLIEIINWTTPSLESLSLSGPLNSIDGPLPELSPLHRDYPKLKRLFLNKWPVNLEEFPLKGKDYLSGIRCLDLSNCGSLNHGKALTEMPNLETLILYNVENRLDLCDSISEITSLRVLDISGEHLIYGSNDHLLKLIKSLPKLVSLDISGISISNEVAEYLPAMRSSSKPMQFLGLFLTEIDPSLISRISALKITNETFENLLLNSCETYINRPEMLKKCLNELFNLFRFGNGQQDPEKAVKILVCVLGRYPEDKTIQVATSATLFYIIKTDEAKKLLGRKIKHLIVTRLLDAMHSFRYDQTMLRNGCLNMIHLRIPTDVISEYTRLAQILLFIVSIEDNDFVQKLGIYLLNLLACQVDGEQKTIVGNLGAIEKMLQLIEARYNHNTCDDFMETAWSTMWNVTDETPVNCERFLNNNGLELFVNCMEKFPGHPELLRNMMGLLGNVSECADLRYRLMQKDYIKRFVQLLDSDSDGIEVSYNSAGILAHIASDGIEVWNKQISKCSRDDMLSKMESAISRWVINSKRNINYRSFEPILRLLRSPAISWQAQYWAVWALANLTRVHSNKYCSLLEKDGGIEVLENFIKAPRNEDQILPISVKCLGVVTLFQCYLFQRFGNLKMLEKSQEIFCFNLIHSPKIVYDFLKKYNFVHLADELKINLESIKNSKIDGDKNLDVLMVDVNTVKNILSGNHSNNSNNNDDQINEDDEEMVL